MGPLFLFTMAFGGLAVPKLNLILALVCRDYFADRAAKDPQFTYLPVVLGADNDQCRVPEVQSLASRFGLYLNLITGLMSAIGSPRLGHLSDRYGRLKLMAFSALMSLFSEMFTIYVVANADTAFLSLLLVGAFVDGLGGSFTLAASLAFSYGADCTAPERRNVVYGYFHAVLFAGMAVGPLLFGFMIKYTGTADSVFYAVIACHTFYFVMLAFVIPESVSKARQMAARELHRATKTETRGGSFWTNLNPLNIIRPLRILFPKPDGMHMWSAVRLKTLSSLRRNLIVLAAVDTVVFAVGMGGAQILILYAEYMFGWHNYESSLFMSLACTTRVIGLLVLLPLATRLFRGPQSQDQAHRGCDRLDLGIIKAAVLFDVIGYIGYVTTRTPGLFIVSAVFASMGGMGSPTLQSSLTKHVPPAETGKILGATGLLHALARVVAPVTFNLIYSATVGKYTQTVFVCLASLFGLSFLLSWFIEPHGKSSGRLRLVPTLTLSSVHATDSTTGSP